MSNQYDELTNPADVQKWLIYNIEHNKPHDVLEMYSCKFINDNPEWLYEKGEFFVFITIIRKNLNTQEKINMINILCSKPININREDSVGFTPLVWAVREYRQDGDIELIKCVINNGASITGNYGGQCFNMALESKYSIPPIIQSNSSPVIDYLLSIGCETRIKFRGRYISAYHDLYCWMIFGYNIANHKMLIKYLRYKGVPFASIGEEKKLRFCWDNDDNDDDVENDDHTIICNSNDNERMIDRIRDRRRLKLLMELLKPVIPVDDLEKTIINTIKQKNRICGMHNDDTTHFDLLKIMNNELLELILIHVNYSEFDTFIDSIFDIMW